MQSFIPNKNGDIYVYVYICMYICMWGCTTRFIFPATSSKLPPSIVIVSLHMFMYKYVIWSYVRSVLK